MLAGLWRAATHVYDVHIYTGYTNVCARASGVPLILGHSSTHVALDSMLSGDFPLWLAGALGKPASQGLSKYAYRLPKQVY